MLRQKNKKFEITFRHKQLVPYLCHKKRLSQNLVYNELRYFIKLGV